jgi:dimethylamine/trimethylamine dehydrogenase
MGVSRYIKEGSLEPYVSYVKSITTKPVVSVGRFTSPDTMVSQIKRGVLDFIGAARPSIADPFLPNKISEGRLDEIRECIGCNICYVGDSKSTPIRCTQNPTIGEEWRRGWHPEKIEPKSSDTTILVIGAGPSGLEASRMLGLRGHHVLLAEAEREPGGRVTREIALPGLSEWSRVRDYRVHQIRSMTNVEIYLDNRMDADDVLAMEADHVVVATGASWRSDGTGMSRDLPIAWTCPPDQVFTPDDIMAGRVPQGPTLIYDDDHYYMGSVIAERLRAEGVKVTLVTPENMVSAWGNQTSEQSRVNKRLLDLDVDIITAHGLSDYDGRAATISCEYTGRARSIEVEAIVTVTTRQPNDGLFRELKQRIDNGAADAPRSLSRIGDCEAPAIIAAAVFSGHRYARELDMEVDPDNRIKYDRVFYEEE